MATLIKGNKQPLKTKDTKGWQFIIKQLYICSAFLRSTKSDLWSTKIMYLFPDGEHDDDNKGDKYFDEDYVPSYEGTFNYGT